MADASHCSSCTCACGCGWVHDPNPDCDFYQEARDEPTSNEDLAAIVRFHGADDVVDALLDMATEIYGSRDSAVERCRAILLRRSTEWISEARDE